MSKDLSSVGLPEDSIDTAAMLAPTGPPVREELPYLVTQWLASYDAVGDEDPEKAAAVAKIRLAASDLASAFSSLGAFGTVSKPFLSSDPSLFLLDVPAPQPATFADARRRWATSCPPNQLESLVEAAALGSAAVDASMTGRQVHLLDASREVILHQKQHPDSGRTLQDEIVVDETKTGGGADERPQISALQRPVAVRLKQPEAGARSLSLVRPSHLENVSPEFVSDIAEKSTEAATLVRTFLVTRDNYRKNDDQIRSLRKSLVFHRSNLQSLGRQRGTILQRNEDMPVDTRLKLLDEIKESEENSNRVIQQLERQLMALEPVHGMDTDSLKSASAAAQVAYRVLQNTVSGYRNPAKSTFEPGKLNNCVLSYVLARQSGLDRVGQMSVPRSMGRIRQNKSVEDCRLGMIKSRMSHAATINTHLAYPVFCLRFDRTGRYFVTGADDYLVRLFCLGANVRSTRTIDSSTLFRGAVLVCTLRGHAGVINDIDVSSDNSFLATASEDGDCRIWGLKDGCPVAILRGHEDGCNMVSWSTLSPYCLVTAGTDGYARSWDVREACLKRYRKYIGRRPEYRLEDIKSSGEPHVPIATEGTAGAVNLPPPPLPVRGNQNRDDSDVPVPPPLPPLPPGANEAPALVEPAAEPAADVEPGQFVSNDLIDDGVKLLEKLRHGVSVEEQMAGPGTRARRAPVRVICIARCPHGGHFATGSDDGICRIWRDDEDRSVINVDNKISRSVLAVPVVSAVFPENRLLLNLKGHISAITDLQYSSKGNRLLSASQKDGVIRIWSWNVDPVACGEEKPAHTHIVIKLTNPGSSARLSSDGPRRRPIRTAGAPVSCDVASWVCDDTRIVTSQCELLKQSSTAIAPGSQYIFVWDSMSGDCLLGFHGAHSMQCPVIIPHPKEPSIFCSGGADGVLKLWDCNAGSCFFVHKNTVDFGPVEPHERGKHCGFLDGAFAPDGFSFVITDDSGRISIFDCAVIGSSKSPSAIPSWMKEQYFSNDYYDLIYDAHGYCVERGSEMPPHLAPKGVRCSHGGASWSDAVNDGFRQLRGPLPIGEQEARWHRQQVNVKAQAEYRARHVLCGNMVSQYDPKTTILLHCDEKTGKVLTYSGEDHAVETAVPLSSPSHQSNVRRLSSNWRWGDAFTEMPEDGNDDDEPDSDDEEFVIGARRSSSNRSGLANGSRDSDDDELDDEQMGFSPERRRSSRYNDGDEDESDVDDLIEYMGTNNEPTGPYAGDYETYFFKMGNEREASVLLRAWLRRVESYSSYTGRKMYVPQLGDHVVYIPRAHQETIVDYPSIVAPWQSWPEGAVWPIVRCCIRHIRYRFPYKSYFKQRDARCKSIVAVLTLEVTGIPEVSQEDLDGLVVPSFTSPTAPHSFELSVFENGQPDYLLPVDLYMARIKMVVEAQDRRGEIPNPPIEAMYRAESQVEDDEFEPWKGRVERFLDDDSNDPNLQGSGFDSIEVSWGSRDERDRVSTWEVNVIGSVQPGAVARPSLSEDEKQDIRRALNEIKAVKRVDEDGFEIKVEDIFQLPVDETRYSDYSTRVEVPMDLSFVSKRIAGDYYANIFSVVADIRLIRENCAKYNSDHDCLTLLANDMAARFEELMLSEDQRNILEKFDKIAAANSSPTEGSAPSEQLGELGRRVTRPRPAPRIRSVLESHSSVAGSNRRVQSLRQQHSRNQVGRTRNISRSVLEDEQTGQRRSSRRSNNSLRARGAASIDQSSLLQSGQGRGRNINGGNSRADSLRQAARRNYREVNSDNEESDPPRNGRRNASNVAAMPESSNAGTQQRGRFDRLARRQMLQEVGSTAESAASSPSAVRRTTRTSTVRFTSDNDDGSERTRRDVPQQTNTENRASRRRSHASRHEEQNSDSDSSSASSVHSGVATAARRTRNQKSKESEKEEDEDEEASANDEADSEDESDMSETELQPKPRNNRRTAQSRAAAHAPSSPPSRGSPRRRARKSYAESSSSELEDNDSELDDAEAVVPNKRKSGSDSGRPSKKIKAEPSSPDHQPSKSWAFLEPKKIGPVGKIVLDQLGADDPEGIFAEPVAEAYPEIAKEYKKVIKKPMDFRTILEDRLPWYQTADGLRDDLMLVFNNCITFNGDDSGYSMLATSMLTELNDVFRTACEENGVRLPRRW